MRKYVGPAGLVITMGLLSSCASEADIGEPQGGCDGGKCDSVDPQDFACQSLVDASGRGSADPSILESLRDPVAARVLQDPQGGCPKTFAEIMDKLRETDGENCRTPFGTSVEQLDEEATSLEEKAAANPDQPDLVAELLAEAERLRAQAAQVRRTAGIRSRIVTERAQLSGGLENPAGGRAPTRAVITRECGDRNTFELVFSLLGVTENGLPQNNTEMIGFDAEGGVFNYYTLRNGQWTFHGNSEDLVTPGNNAECGACHTGGGLIMKELNAPWVHWEGDTVTPGLDALFDAHEDLGERSDGIDMEGPLVASGNDRWNETRIRIASEPDNTDFHGGSMKALLAPLFCDSEFNLQSAGAPGGSFPPFPGPLPPFPGPVFPQAAVDPDVAADRTGAVSFLPADFFADSLIGAGRVNVDGTEYQRALINVGSRIQGRDSTIVQRRADPGLPDDEDGPALDTFFGFTFPERAGADLDFVNKLQAEDLDHGLGEGRIVDREFVMDVLSVDFTRPVFSDERCALLEFVPTFEEFANVDLTAEPSPPPNPDPHVCCEAKPQPPLDSDFERDDHVGCAQDPAVEEAVCAADAFCCAGPGSEQGFWDSSCARQTQSVAGEFCVADTVVESETTKRIRLAMTDKLKNAASRGQGDSAAATLLSNLVTPDQKGPHQGKVRQFVDACSQRAADADEQKRMQFLEDVFTVAARIRSDARRFSPVLEFGETMVTDDTNPSAGAHLDAVTCQLVP